MTTKNRLRSDGSPTLVFDMMQPERPKVDKAVLGFLRTEGLHPVDFTIREDGVEVKPAVGKKSN